MYIRGQERSDNQTERRLSGAQLSTLTAYINANYSNEQKADIAGLTDLLNDPALIDNQTPQGEVDRAVVTKKEFVALLEADSIPLTKIENILGKKVFEALGDQIDFNGDLEIKIFTHLKDENVITEGEVTKLAAMKKIDDPNYQQQIPGTSPAEDEIVENIVLEIFDVKAALNGGY